MVERVVAASDEQRERLFLARGTARGMQVVAALLLLNALLGPLSYFIATGTVRLSPALLGGVVALVVLAYVHLGQVGRAMGAGFMLGTASAARSVSVRAPLAIGSTSR